MLRKFLILLVSTALSAHAQQGNSLLYKISGNGLPEASYVYGTIHAACPENLKITKAITASMDATKQLYLEIDLDDPKMMLTMMQNMGMKDGKTLPDLLSAAEYTELRMLFKEISKMDLEAFKKMKPYLLTSFLIPAMTNCTPSAWEMELMKIASAQKEEVLGIETILDQLAVFDAVDYQTQAKEILKALRDFKTMKADFEDLSKTYMSQDVEALYRVGTKDDLSKTFEKSLLTDRNKAWVEKMPAIMQAKPTFFGVGAGHLGGPNGVLKLLKAKGYKVEVVLNNE